MKQKDNNKRTPLHYAAFIDINEEEEDSNITLALLLNGGESTLFEKDKDKVAPVYLIGTSTLKTLLDTKQRIEGPVGDKNCVVHIDASIFQPLKSPYSRKKLVYLWMLASKHKDLFDHPVITAIIWYLKNF